MIRLNDGRDVDVKTLSDVVVTRMLKMLRHVAMSKYQAILDIYEQSEDMAQGIARNHFQIMQAEVKAKGWEGFVDDEFFDLRYEAAKRKLLWDAPIDEIPLTGPNRASFERQIAGALKDAINAHGPIIKENVSSAAKRVISIIKEHNKNVRKA